MKTFNLPDLGEGLKEAEIVDWLIQEGDTVKLDQPIVSVETDKALVEIPSPLAGTIIKFHAKAGSIVNVGAPLIDYKTEITLEDKGTVVGRIESSDTLLDESHVIIGSPSNTATQRPNASPKVRQFAKEKGLSLAQLTPTGENNTFTLKDIENAISPSSPSDKLGGGESLKGARRAMAKHMINANDVTQATLTAYADIHHLGTKADLTCLIIQAIIHACHEVPAVNAWFNQTQLARLLKKDINLGLAIDTAEGLFVPVIKKVQALNTTHIRKKIDQLKSGVVDRSLAPNDFTDATLSFSNFGVFGVGEFASLVVVPPMVAIIGCGKYRDTPVAEKGKTVIHRLLPLSLSFDHRALTGGEAGRFLKALIDVLENKKD